MAGTWDGDHVGNGSRVEVYPGDGEERQEKRRLRHQEARMRGAPDEECQKKSRRQLDDRVTPVDLLLAVAAAALACDPGKYRD